MKVINLNHPTAADGGRWPDGFRYSGFQKPNEKLTLLARARTLIYARAVDLL